MPSLSGSDQCFPVAQSDRFAELEVKETWFFRNSTKGELFSLEPQYLLMFCVFTPSCAHTRLSIKQPDVLLLSRCVYSAWLGCGSLIVAAE